MTYDIMRCEKCGKEYFLNREKMDQLEDIWQCAQLSASHIEDFERHCPDCFKSLGVLMAGSIESVLYWAKSKKSSFHVSIARNVKKVLKEYGIAEGKLEKYVESIKEKEAF